MLGACLNPGLSHGATRVLSDGLNRVLSACCPGDKPKRRAQVMVPPWLSRAAEAVVWAHCRERSFPLST